jgi:hypothetical protein
LGSSLVSGFLVTFFFPFFDKTTPGGLLVAGILEAPDAAFALSCARRSKRLSFAFMLLSSVLAIPISMVVLIVRRKNDGLRQRLHPSAFLCMKILGRFVCLRLQFREKEHGLICKMHVSTFTFDKNSKNQRTIFREDTPTDLMGGSLPHRWHVSPSQPTDRNMAWATDKSSKDDLSVNGPAWVAKWYKERKFDAKSRCA